MTWERSEDYLWGMTRSEMLEESLTRSAIGAFFEVYNTLGFGFPEHVYVRALEYELLNRGHTVGREQNVVVMYKGFEIARPRLDLIVADKLIIETKSTYELHPAATRNCTTIFAEQAWKWASSTTLVPNQSSTA